MHILITIHPFTLLAVKLQNNDDFEVGKRHEVNCTVYTMNHTNVNISWIGPNGIITNENSNRIIVIPTTSNGSIHTSTLQFSYVSEEDENTSCNCTASLSGGHGSLSKSFTMSNLTSKLNYYHTHCMKAGKTC